MLVSVVIPCRNEEKYIAQCIDSIIESDYPKEKIEIIIVDGMSNDHTIAIIKSYIKEQHCIKLIENHKQTTQWALNKGIVESTGDVIIILGAHASISKNYISGCVEILKKENDIMCAGGLVENVFDNNTSKIIGKAMSSSFGVGNAYFRTGGKSGFVDTVAFGAYKKEIFEKIGLFDEDLVRNQDDEYNYRLTKNGYKIYLETNLKLLYYTRASYTKLFNQYFQYGYWKVYVNKKHKTITTLRQVVPSLFVAFLFLGFLTPFSNIYIRFGYRFTILIYLLLAIKNGLNKTDTLKELSKFIYACIILHISYGSGYIMGLFTFFIMRKKPSDFSKGLTR